MKPLTPSQRDALLIAAELDPRPVYSSMTNELRVSAVASGSARVLVDRGLLADTSRGALSTLRITDQGRAAAETLRKENHDR